MNPKFRAGNAVYPHAEGKKIICHVVNDIGAWGAGFVIPLAMRWPIARDAYFAWGMHPVADSHYKRLIDLTQPPEAILGNTQFVPVDDDVIVANMMAQRGLTNPEDRHPLRLDALRKCLRTVAEKALEIGASVHMPRIGCGLGGGDWRDVGPLVETELSDRDVDTTVYDLIPSE